MEKSLQSSFLSEMSEVKPDPDEVNYDVYNNSNFLSKLFFHWCVKIINVTFYK